MTDQSQKTASSPYWITASRVLLVVLGIFFLALPFVIFVTNGYTFPGMETGSDAVMERNLPTWAYFILPALFLLGLFFFGTGLLASDQIVWDTAGNLPPEALIPGALLATAFFFLLKLLGIKTNQIPPPTSKV